MTIGLIDSNVLLRHLAADNPDHAPRATALIGRIERGEIEANLADTVIFETVFVLDGLYKMPRPAIREDILALLSMQGMLLEGKQIYQRIFAWFVTYPQLSFADCYHAALVEQQRLPAIVSFDRGFDRVADIRRIEPD